MKEKTYLIWNENKNTSLEKLPNGTLKLNKNENKTETNSILELLEVLAVGIEYLNDELTKLKSNLEEKK